MIKISWPEREALEKRRADSEARAFKTFTARVTAHRRLRTRNVAWNASLVATSTATTVASVALLSDPSIYGSKGDTVFAALAILSLVASLVVSNVDYGGRARAMEDNYKLVQRIAIDLEHLSVRTRKGKSDLTRLRAEYAAALAGSENHSTADHLRQSPSHTPAEKRILVRDSVTTFAPYLSMAIPVAVIIPVLTWLAA